MTYSVQYGERTFKPSTCHPELRVSDGEPPRFTCPERQSVRWSLPLRTAQCVDKCLAEDQELPSPGSDVRLSQKIPSPPSPDEDDSRTASRKRRRAKATPQEDIALQEITETSLCPARNSQRSTPSPGHIGRGHQ